MLCNSYSKRFCDFYIFPIVGIGAINFQNQKRGNPPFFQGVFLSKRSGKKLLDFDFHKLHNVTNVFVQNLCFYRARFSIQRLFKTTPCPLKRQRENHTGVLASDSSHEYTVDRWSKTHTQTRQAICMYVLPASKTLVKSKKIYHLNTLHLYPAKTNKDSKTNKERVAEFLYQVVELSTSNCSIFIENEGLVQIKITITNHDVGPNYTLH